MTADAAPRSGVEALGDFVAGFAKGALPSDVDRAVRLSIVDTIGVAIGGADVETVPPFAAFLLETAKEGPCTLIGRDERISPPAAALYNGTLAHSLDFDDTHMPTVVHPTACALPAALALAQARDARLDEVIEAVALGNEVALRIGMAAHDHLREASVIIARGLHPTAFCGPFGSAAASARMLGLSPGQTAHALAIVANLVSGTLEPNRSGGTLKRFFCGWAAQSGLIAAELAGRGVTGPASALEGQFGLFASHLGADRAPEGLTDELASRWEILAIGFKPYPSNVYTHSAIDTARTLVDSSGKVNPESVLRIDVAVPTAVAAVVGEPIAQKRRPKSSHEARFSIPFVVARTLLGDGGGLGPDDFTPQALESPATIALCNRIHVAADQGFDRSFPRKVGCRITVMTTSGKTSSEVATARGSRSAPLTEPDLLQKFARLAEAKIGAAAAREWPSRVLTVGGFASANAMLEPLAPRFND